jgi:hypothetical protein
LRWIPKGVKLSAPNPPIGISSISGGTIGTRPWKMAIAAIIKQINAIREEYSSPLSLQIVFQIPGEVIRPDFTGVRTGLFSRRDGRLVVHVAVPDDVEGDRVAWVITRLREAVAEAEKFAIMEALPDTDFSGLGCLIDAVAGSVA